MSIFLSPAKRFSRLFLVILLSLPGAVFALQDEGHVAQEHGASAPAFNASEVILNHVMDDHIWHLWDHGGTIYLPIIVYSSEKGLDVFSSHHFYDEHHNVVEYNGYKLDHHKIYLTESNKAVLDLSITKNVAMLLINATVLVLVFSGVAKGYKRNNGKSPKGIQSFLEPVIVFVRDEIVKPNIGKHYEKYLPYMLTLLLFILF